MDLKSFKWKIKMWVSRFWELRINTKEYFCNSKISFSNRKAYLERAILVGAHSLERSLGFRNSAPGHSISECAFLLARIEEWINKGFKSDDFCIKEGIAVLNYYLSLQDEKNDTIKKLIERTKKLIEKLPPNISLDINAGIRTCYKDELVLDSNESFRHIVESRHSIRQFSDSPISIEEIKEIIDLTNMAPSACNRQPIRVYVALGKEKMERIHQGFTINKSFRDEFNGYLIVTARRNLFYGFEHYQWYINGGIYLGYLSLALHSYNIGSCIMQWKAFDKNENVLKKICGINKNEAIIAIVGIGKYDTEAKTLYSQRLNSSENMIIV